MDIEIKQITKDYMNVLYLAGRGCYGLEEIDETLFNSKRDFIKKLIANEHESVLEHGIISIFIIGCSRSFMSQITRHRLASFSIKSQHYVDHSNFKVKELETESVEAQTIYNDVIRIIKNRYKQMVNEFNIPIHIAREILPNACLTNIFMTANFREWRYIIKLRNTFKNTMEMHHFASKIRNLFRNAVPYIFDDL